MKIEYRNGNLFLDQSVSHIVHCCNSHGRMGSGFAKELRARYPGAYQVYHEEYEKSGLSMGQIVPYQADDGRLIFNLIGQRDFGYDGARYVSYDALAKGMECLDELALELTMTHLHMPLMGAVLAGGRWSIISSIIEAHSSNYQPVVHLLDGKIPD